MFRIPVAAALVLCLAAAACRPQTGAPPRSPSGSPARPSSAPSPPGRLPPAAQAILSDQAVGAPRRKGQDHLTAAEAAGGQPDQAASLAEYEGWAWLDGSSRGWPAIDETLVITARADTSARAFAFWAADAPMPCSATAAAGLDGCRLGSAGDRAVVVGRLASAVFRLQCPAQAADRLTIAQAAALRAAVA